MARNKQMPLGRPIRDARTNVRNGAEGMESTLRERFPRSMPAYGAEHPYARAPLGHWMFQQEWLPPREELQHFFPTAMRPGQSMANPYEQGMYAPQTLREGAAPSGWIYGPQDVRNIDLTAWSGALGWPEGDVTSWVSAQPRDIRAYRPTGIQYGDYMPPGDPRLGDWSRQQSGAERRDFSPQRMLERPTGRPSPNVGPPPMFFPTLAR